MCPRCIPCAKLLPKWTWPIPRPGALQKESEAALGFALLDSSTGGKHGGGARLLTPENGALLARYDAYTDALRAANLSLFRKHFPEDSV